MTAENDVRVVVATDASQREDAIAIRRSVFVDEQDVPADLELDEYDDDPATVHLVAYDGAEAVGTARLRPYGECTDSTTDSATPDSATVGKVQRVAVVADSRGHGWGRRLMTRVETVAREEGYDRLALDVQTQARGFYERLGYVVTDETEFLDAGIPHVAMEKQV